MLSKAQFLQRFLLFFDGSLKRQFLRFVFKCFSDEMSILQYVFECQFQKCYFYTMFWTVRPPRPVFYNDFSAFSLQHGKAKFYLVFLVFACFKCVEMLILHYVFVIRIFEMSLLQHVSCILFDQNFWNSCFTLCFCELHF